MIAANILPSLPEGAEVLVIRLRSMGDMVLLTPSLRALKSWRPDLSLTVLVERPFAAVLEGNPDVSDVIIRGPFLATSWELRRRRFAAVFNQHGGPTSALLALASGSPVRVCWSDKRFASLFHNFLVPESPVYYGRRDYHTVDDRLAQFFQAGLPFAPPPPSRVYPRPEAAESFRCRLEELRVDTQRPVAVIHPSGNKAKKIWPMERFAETARWLREEKGLQPMTVLGPSDRHLAVAAREHLGREGAVIEDLSLAELIVLLGGARLFVGNDSGPAHLAAAAGCPPVVVFGSSNFVRWSPWGGLGKVVRNEFACSPCRGKTCRTFSEPRCILSVTVAQVRKACEEVLAGGRFSGRGRADQGTPPP